MSILTWFLAIYGVLALSHILIQIYLGHLEHRKQDHRYFRGYHKGHREKITVVVPAFNEKPAVLSASIESILMQKYDAFEIIIIDDGSKNYNELKSKVYAKYKNSHVQVLRSKENIGKRHAQYMAFKKATGDIIVTIDSDTILRTPNTLARIARRFKDPKVGAVTGDVQVENNNQNLLTKIISYRYWTAFHQERAAQSYFHVMMCCSGPFSAYRRVVIENVKDEYVSQRFLGKLCTFGDDRHLTNLVLREGWEVVFDKTAKAYTHVPDTLREYLNQQVRWNKSFYREMLWTLKAWKQHHAYLIYELTMQFILPFLLVIALAAMVYQAVFIDINSLWQYLGILIGIALLRALYGLYRTKDAGFLLFIMYGFVHVLLLIPVRFYALATIGTVKWGTRVL